MIINIPDIQFSDTAWQIIAVFTSPILAFQIQRVYEDRKQAKQRKINVFKTLMATRGARLSLPHVEALNMIDIEYYGRDRKSQNVLESWNEYRDSLGMKADNEIANEAIWRNRNDKFIELLANMADCLGYKFTRRELRSSGYSPEGQYQLEEEQNQLRRSFLRLISRGYLPVVESEHLVPQTTIGNMAQEWLERDKILFPNVYKQNPYIQKPSSCESQEEGKEKVEAIQKEEQILK